MRTAEKLGSYRWSSHHAYTGNPGPVTVDTALVLEQLGNTVGQARKSYRKFIEDGQNLGHEERYYQAVDQRFLGDEKFIQRVVERVPQAEVRPGGRKVRFERLISAVAEVHGCGAKDLVSSRRKRGWAKPRAQLAYVARAWCGMKAIEIARHLNRDASMVSRLCTSYEAVRDLQTEKKIVEAIDK